MKSFLELVRIELQARGIHERLAVITFESIWKADAKSRWLSDGRLRKNPKLSVRWLRHCIWSRVRTRSLLPSPSLEARPTHSSFSLTPTSALLPPPPSGKSLQGRRLHAYSFACNHLNVSHCCNRETLTMSANVRSRRRVKYTEQPFPTAGTSTEAQVNEQLESRLFKIPRELRTEIYDMVYQNNPLPVDVAAMFYGDGLDAPHSTALILTCRRILNECKATFDRASSVYWQKDFTINVYEHPRIWRSLDWLPDEFIAHIRKFKLVVSLREMPVSLTLRAKTDGQWHLDTTRQPSSDDDKLPSLEADLKERLKELQAPEGASKAFQGGKSYEAAFKAFTGDGLRLLLSM